MMRGIVAALLLGLASVTLFGCEEAADCPGGDFENGQVRPANAKEDVEIVCEDGFEYVGKKLECGWVDLLETGEKAHGLVFEGTALKKFPEGYPKFTGSIGKLKQIWADMKSAAKRKAAPKKKKAAPKAVAKAVPKGVAKATPQAVAKAAPKVVAKAAPKVVAKTGAAPTKKVAVAKAVAAKNAPERRLAAPKQKDKVKTDVLPPVDFDCEAGYAHWQLGWSDEKKTFCCGQERNSCPSTPALPLMVDISKLTCTKVVAPFDCDAGIKKWMTGWSDAKKKYCCTQHKKGCEDEEDLFDCKAGASKCADGWSAAKKKWCLKKGNGCPTDVEMKYAESPPVGKTGVRSFLAGAVGFGVTAMLVGGAVAIWRSHRDATGGFASSPDMARNLDPDAEHLVE